MKTELWVVPMNGEIPKITNFLDYAKNERYKLEKLDTKIFEIEEAKLETEEGENVESENNDLELKKERLAFLTKNTNEFFNGYSKELSEILVRNKTWTAILFFYADKDVYDIQKLQEIAETQIRSNSKKLNVEFNQIEISFGGYKPRFQIDTWILPKNGITPKAMPFEKF
jgi:DNA repair ATPase RecN